MATTSTNFTTESQLATTATVLASVASGSTNISTIRAASFFNKSSTVVVTVTVYRYASSATDNSIIIQKDIAPRRSWNCAELQGKVIEAGFTVAASASVAGMINAECDGVIATVAT